MKILLPGILLLFFAASTLSCHEDEKPTGNREQLIVGRWNTTYFAPERENMLSSIYAAGMTFYADHNFALRYPETDGWREGNIVGSYRLVDKETIELSAYPGTNDESVVKLQIDRLDDGVFWFRDNLLEFDQSPNPSEYHLERVE